MVSKATYLESSSMMIWNKSAITQGVDKDMHSLPHDLPHHMVLQ